MTANSKDIHILSIMKEIVSLHNASPRYYKISHRILYITNEAEARRCWERPEKTTSEEHGEWQDFHTFVTETYIITNTGNAKWTITSRKDGQRKNLAQTWYWRTPENELHGLDTTDGIGIEIARLFSEGQICYLRDLGTLYCKSRNQQFGISNFNRILKLDRGSSTWFVYDDKKKDFKPVTALCDQERFQVLRVEDLNAKIFKPEPSRAWTNLKWAAGHAANLAIPFALTSLLGSTSILKSKR